MHVITLPFKLTFALVPPTEFLGGWACFFVALSFIGGVTCFIGDLASIFGCLIDWPGWKPDPSSPTLSIAMQTSCPCSTLTYAHIQPDSITAITLVALGTSLPDTFASKAAARSDDDADASIGNVTGSNAVRKHSYCQLTHLLVNFHILLWFAHKS